MPDYLLFAVTYFAAAMAPGADTMLVLSRALENQRRAWLAGAGIALAKLVLLAVAYFGATTIIASNPALVVAAKFFGAAYLGYRAIVLWRRAGVNAAANSSKGLADLGIGFATAFTNPQPIAFYLAIVPQVAATTELGWLSVIVVIGFGIVTLLYAALARPVSELLKKRGPKVLNRSIAVLLLGVATWILLR